MRLNKHPERQTRSTSRDALNRGAAVWKMTLLNILTGNISYDNSFAIYAEKIGGHFHNDSPARFGQTQFENGGLLDDCEFFATNDSARDSIELWADGDEDASEEGAEMLICEINKAAE